MGANCTRRLGLPEQVHWYGGRSWIGEDTYLRNSQSVRGKQALAGPREWDKELNEKSP